ncbi:MAG: hypothetical protein SF097_25410 [Acidobacteriota bacterium]|nr:hypothetical protein [Acidobacteriota bacterium]
MQKNENKSFADIVAQFAEIATALQEHPQCPASIANLLNDIESEAFNEAQTAVSGSPSATAKLNCALLKITLPTAALA